MCGIVGIAGNRPSGDRTLLTAGRDLLSHRGPDGAGEWWSDDGRVGLAHRRLAIIDLSCAGDQPMHDVSGQSVVVFNGEIYNFQDIRRELASRGHTFRTATDTEAILAAYLEWGVDCVSHFNGMFAFALFDRSRQRLFLARDRAGEKPLFYAVTEGTLRFASELKALFADPAFPRRVNRDALDCYLAMGYVPGARCILDGVSKLPPAHALTFEIATGAATVRRYWQLPPKPSGPAEDAPESELLDELESLLENAVRRQLVADVPVGILLSGGVDSSLVTAMAARAAPKVKTFTIRFPGHGAYDETEHARLIARHFATEHIELEAADSTVDLLPRLARQFDEPLVDSSMIPTFLVSQLIRAQCTVALGGDGGDELFGGYPHYPRVLWMQDRVGALPRIARAAIGGTAARLLPVGFKGRNWLEGLGVDLRTGVPLIATIFDRRARHRLMAPRGPWALVAEGIREARLPISPDLLQRATRLDFENYLAEDILVKVDRASMLSSLEVRAPFLDYRIIEFAFGKVPSRFKATRSSRKVLLKKLCGRLLPPTFDSERKQGFSIPLAQWLRSGPWHDFFQELLLNSEGSPFARPFVQELLDAQEAGRSHGERLFALALFELWRQEYRVTIPDAG